MDGGGQGGGGVIIHLYTSEECGVKEGHKPFWDNLGGVLSVLVLLTTGKKNQLPGLALDGSLTII
jgi:hypothetical protein